MNTTQLKYFIEAADAGNITRAAEKLYISQQALSSHIRKLETALETELFERKPALTLTYAGERLYRYAKEMLEQEAALMAELRQMQDGTRGILTLGISHTRGRVFLPLVLPAFHTQFPEVEIRLMEGNSELLSEYLENGTVDFVIAADGFSKAEYETRALMTEHLYWCCRPEYMEAVQGGRWEELPFVLMIRENRVRRIVDGYFARKGIKPRILTESDNIETVLSLAAEGMGVTVYPAQFLENRRAYLKDKDPLQYCPVDDPSTDTVLVAAWKKEKFISRFEQAFLKVCEEKAKENR